MDESSIFYPDPWEGGTASMKQMVDYHLTASMGVDEGLVNAVRHVDPVHGEKLNALVTYVTKAVNSRGFVD